MSYAAGSFGTGVFSTVPSVLLLYYCTETLLLAPQAVAIILVLPKLCSIVWDPYVGAWSDAVRSSWGRRRPFMIVGAAGTSLLFAAVFSPPDFTPPLLLLWVALAYFTMNAFYSLFAVPYTAVPAEIAGNGAMTLRLVGARMMVLMIGILAGAAGAPVLIAAFDGGRDGYAAMGTIVAAACFIAMLLPIRMLSRHDYFSDTSWRPPSIGNHLAGMRVTLANRAYRCLLFSFLAQAAAYGGVSAALPYIISQMLGRNEADIGAGLGVVIIASFATVPIWTIAGKRLGFAAGIAIAGIGYALATMSLAISIYVAGSWGVALLLMGVAGTFFAGLQVLPFSFAAEIVRSTAPAEEAKFAGLWVAAEKFGLAGGAAILSLVLALGNDAVVSTLYAGIAPMVLVLLSLPWLFASTRTA
nr:MFS transporter [Exilibacterium tricleocarpae]